MADHNSDKKLKLANTKKRFKELQELKKKRNGGQNAQDSATNENVSVHSTESSSRNTPVEAVSMKTLQEICFNDNVVNTNSKTGSKQNLYEPDTINPLHEHFLNEEESTNEAFISKSNETGHNETSSHNMTESNPILNVNPINTTHNIENKKIGTIGLPNYFGSPEAETPAAFFDNISPQNSSETPPGDKSPSLLTYFNTSLQGRENANSYAENIGLPKYFDNINSSSTIWENTVPENRPSFVEDYTLFPKKEENIYANMNQHEVSSDDVLSLDDPEIKQNEIRDYSLKKTKIVDVPTTKVDQFSHDTDDIVTPDTEKLIDEMEKTGATEEEKVIVHDTAAEIDVSTNITQKEIMHSNTESLKQLSDQLAQIIQPNYQVSSPGSITELEKRNSELAAHLEQERLHSLQWRSVSAQLQGRIAQLEADFENQQAGSNLQSAQEINHLKNELQAHLQTIGLLVAEKTELSSNLSHYELMSKQKIAECEELQARLKASRGRVADLERELNNLRAEKSKTDSLGEQYSASLENLKQEYTLLKEKREEIVQEMLEVREKLKNAQEENMKLQEENKDLSSKLSLAEIKIQQLSSGMNLGADSQVEQLIQDKFSLEAEIANLSQMLKSIIKERDESTLQYQQYAQQLNAQVSNLSSKLEQLLQEKENLIVQEQNRIKHIGELERQLQTIQNDQVAYITRSSSHVELKNEVDNIRELCVQLQVEKTTAEENFTRVSNEKELLLKELEAKTDSISQLETMLEQLKGNQPDSVKLLATMESDKVAASRAIQQNKELKQQLESLQQVFRKMDDDKVVLTENLKAQQQTNKDLLEKLQKTELILQSLADAIEIKDRELTHLRTTAEESNKHMLTHEHLEDKLRHYEAHDHSAHILQHELQEAKQKIAKLTAELNDSGKKAESTEKEEHVSELQESRRRIVELTNEINRLKVHFDDRFNGASEESKIKVEPAEEVVIEDIQDRNENILDKEKAMRCLEEKVKRTMQEIADLTDEKQRLEHIVLQLQSETETIGEYVALYQHQRMVLKQKALEKDQQLRQLADDREQIKGKLDRLNRLIKKLVTEKGAVPVELIQHHESMDAKNFCEEHSKINDELLKISKSRSNVIEPDDEKNVMESSRTAEEIISLLSEIKTSNLVQPDENIHHCPWCSGQLITV